MRTVHVGLSAGHGSTKEAEHWLHDLGLDLPAGTIACTHLVHRPWPHVALSLAVPHHGSSAAPVLDGLPPVPAELTGAAADARAEHAERRAGRAVLYPGVDRLVGELTVAELLAMSAIEAVTVLGGPQPEPADVIGTRDFVRPQWIDGRLVLMATPVEPGRIAPFEIPDPVACCTFHGR
jgi:hypothetical protein